MAKALSIVGQKFNRLTVIRQAPSQHYPSGQIKAYWFCKCDCGNECKVAGGLLKSNRTKSCGCKQIENRKTNRLLHGESKAGSGSGSSEYIAWMSMRERCNNRNQKNFANYGGRGIAVCERWESFENFLEDMGRKPKGTSIDRIDNNGNYEPSNCRWATIIDQARNKRSNKMLTIRGVTFCQSEWCKRIGMRPQMLTQRLSRGWTPEKAIYTPTRSER